MRENNGLIPVFFDPTHKRWVGFIALMSAALMFVGFLLTTLSISIYNGPEFQSFALSLPDDLPNGQANVQSVSADGRTGLEGIQPAPAITDPATTASIAQISSSAPSGDVTQPILDTLPTEDFFLAPKN